MKTWPSLRRCYRILLHMLFWGMAIGFYILFFSNQNDNFALTIFFVALLIPVTISTTYFINYYLIPRHLFSHRYKSFVLYFIYTINLSVYLDMMIILATFIIMAKYNVRLMEAAMMDIMTIVAASFMIVFSAMAIKLVFSWLNVQKENQQLIIEKIESELKFLKSQIHPHFLFNTLNNLYCLTVDKSDKAPEVVLKLSELLDYMLHECSPKFVSLEKEIHQLRNYISLESLRYSDRLSVEVILSGNIAHQKIAPLLLITLMENCFKHGVMNAAGNCWINVTITALENTVEIVLKNSKTNSNHSSNSGIGLQNVRSQLNLLYPERHTISINERLNEFETNILIKSQSNNIYADQMSGN